jgi:hypothetical protein
MTNEKLWMPERNKAKGGKKNRQVSDVSSTPEKNLKEIKAQVAALKRSLSQLKSSSSDSKETENVDDDDTPDNAGGSFRGHSCKKSKKDRLIGVALHWFLTVAYLTWRWLDMYCNRVTRRIISAHVSSTRRYRSTAVSKVKRDATTYSCMELDSHAYTVVWGAIALFYH